MNLPFFNPTSPFVSQALTPVVNKSLFVESGTYQPMELRTYETNFNMGKIDVFNEITDGGRNLTRNALSAIASDIITPASAPSASLTIEEGWGTRRFTFIIEIKAPETAYAGSAPSTVLTGYTNYCDVSCSNNFDPNMRLYFNSSSIIDKVTTRLANGQTVERKVLKDSSHLLGAGVIYNIHPYERQKERLATEFNPYPEYSSKTVYWMTPKHVVDEMSNQANASSYNGALLTFDRRRASNPLDVVRSRRDNAVTGSYLSGILSNVINESNNVIGTTDDELTSLSGAAFKLKELANYSDAVITLIINGSDYIRNGYITWREMCLLFPDLNDKTLYTPRTTASLSANVPVPDSTTVEHWRGTNYETTIANSLAQLVPALMTSSLIGNLSFTFTNDNLTMEPELIIFNGNALIDGLDLYMLTNKFTHRFISEVVPIITNQNRSVVSLMVHSNIGAETHINVSYEHGATIPFCAPTFCDAMYSPIVTPFENNLTEISSDLYNLANVVSNQQLYL